MNDDFPRIVVPLEIRRKMVEIAREFRKDPMPGEKILWNALRGKRLDGIKFRRQQPTGYFVVDFYSSAYRLVAEVDGQIHAFQINADRSRQEILEILGLVVLRIKSETVEKNLPIVLALIRDSIRLIGQNKNEAIPSPDMWDGKGGG